MVIHNYTPHAINLYVGDECVRTFESEGIARCDVTRKKVGTIPLEGIEIPVYQTELSSASELPEPAEDHYYIVSRAYAEHSMRKDLLIPDDAVRDSEGRIIGCRAFATEAG